MEELNVVEGGAKYEKTPSSITSFAFDGYDLAIKPVFILFPIRFFH